MLPQTERQAQNFPRLVAVADLERTEHELEHELSLRPFCQ